MLNKKNIDPVCGMQLAEHNIVVTIDGRDFSFCSPSCKVRFNSDPERFQGIPLLTLRNVKKEFVVGDVVIKVLRGLSLNIWKGDFVTIIGASGSGKSTVLNMIGLLDVPTSGKVLVNGKNIDTFSDDKRAELRSQTFGFVFQQYNLIPWLTAKENVTLPLLFSAKSRSDKELAAQFKEIGLIDRMHHRPLELSGGEQQRTAILRALVNEPDIIIGDEPTGNLDSKTGQKILQMLIDLHKKEGRTLIIVTHDEHIAKKADQVITIKDGLMVDCHKDYQKIYTE